MNNNNFLKVVLWPLLECLFQSKLDVPTFVASNLLLKGLVSMDMNGTTAIAIIKGCSFASMEGSLDT